MPLDSISCQLHAKTHMDTLLLCDPMPKLSVALWQSGDEALISHKHGQELACAPPEPIEGGHRRQVAVAPAGLDDSECTLKCQQIIITQEFVEGLVHYGKTLRSQPIRHPVLGLAKDLLVQARVPLDSLCQQGFFCSFATAEFGRLLQETLVEASPDELQREVSERTVLGARLSQQNGIRGELCQKAVLLVYEPHKIVGVRQERCSHFVGNAPAIIRQSCPRIRKLHTALAPLVSVQRQRFASDALGAFEDCDHTVATLLQETGHVDSSRACADDQDVGVLAIPKRIYLAATCDVSAAF
mmetsp:Transcript_17235/g.40445  ORF Transcript_17235/g.40445 Transcript_17235/m.40445 type:complete len:299 (-) Transcript_17235:28-924(-)